MRINKRTLIKDILWAIVFAGIVASVLRFALGLGSTTGMSDASPWGLWIALKLGFVALAGGGFTLAGLVYILRLKTFRPIIRRAITLAMLGYGSFIVSLIFDLGLPWNIYMPVIHWQHHSVMFEIAWCVILYFSVLVLEFSPVILEHPWFQKPVFQFIRKIMHALLIPLVIAGIVLSTLHQSSLGSLFLIMPHRVHPLWYSPLIPPLFFITAITAGLYALVLENFLSARFFKRSQDPFLLSRLSVVGAWSMLLYLGLRIGDLFWRGVLPKALNGTWQSVLFSAEILVGGFLPVALVAVPKIRRRREVLLTSAILGILGIISQRMSLSMFTMDLPGEAAYMPSLLEGVIGLAIPAAAVLIYLFFSENLVVLDYPKGETGPVPNARQFPGVLNLLAGGGLCRNTLGRRSAVAVIVAALSLAGASTSVASRQQVAEEPVRGALGWEVMRIDGNRREASVDFPHTEHQARQLTISPQGASGCQVCHHLSVPGDGPTSCWECHRDMSTSTTIFDHLAHQQALGGNDSCNDCHLGEHLAATAKDCQTCHKEMAPEQSGGQFETMARSYQDAMHTLCISCHQEQVVLGQDPELGGCTTCHFQPELHADSFSQDCGTCHTPDEWFALVRQQKQDFDHEHLANFSLDHHMRDYGDKAILCVDCHPTIDSFESGFESQVCLDCHTLDSPSYMADHQTQHGLNCLACHDGVDRMVTLDHSRSFDLEGQHAAVECETCHVDHVFDGTPGTCSACHPDPEVHAGLFGLNCNYCHFTSAWAPTALQKHPFPLSHGGGGSVNCEACHLGSYTRYTCYECHDAHQRAEMIQVHTQEVLGGVALDDCATCHTGEGVKGDGSEIGFLDRK